MLIRRNNFLLILLTVLLAGCFSGDGYEYVPVTGRLTIDGKPLADIQVYFSPKLIDETGIAGPPSAGTTDNDGNYSLRVLRKGGSTGAIPGTHFVKFLDQNEVSESTGEEEDFKPIASRIPRKYNDGLDFIVPKEGTDAANFELTSN
ncbi:hypothetical protein [Calycomorphotria hydatis]|uniref:Carboxypeptidase regulatory-like domain-containing protein n=1 Tax=Calycomorphotria hydatis TaxID=2528027 RepID=A0A517TDD6_9PLAN|nr:hypothetical protein [Calycomorphotria hydatis]QDT66384.1 hypothetical protein V22_36510 [Calycomorphotria hydatis]